MSQFLKSLCREAEQKIQEVSESRKKFLAVLKSEGFYIFYNISCTFQGTLYDFDYIAVKKGYCIVYTLSIECEQNSGIYGESFAPEKIFYNGRFPELFYHDKNKKIVSSYSSVIRCPTFIGDIYQETFDILRCMSSEQHQATDFQPDYGSNLMKICKGVLDSSDHKYQGLAGCGKTFAMCYAAAKYVHEKPEKKILICTFNITIKNKIRHLLGKMPFSYRYNQIGIDHYHNIFYSNKGIDISSFSPDIILCDEAQDFEAEWMKGLKKYASKIIFFGDSEQDCYAQNPLNELDDHDVKAPYAPIPGKWSRLEDKQYRNHNRIFSLAVDFRRKFIDPHICVPEISDKDNSRILYTHCSERQIITEVQKVLRSFQKNSLNETAILSHRYQLLQSLYHDLKTKCLSVAVYTMFHETALSKEKDKHRPFKEAFNPYKKGIKLSTLHSFKGMEAKNVILILQESDFLHSGNGDCVDNQKYLRTYYNSVYLGLSRATQKLFIIDATTSQRGFEKFFEINPFITRQR